MRSDIINVKFFITGSLMLLFIFVHLVGIVDSCKYQKTNNITTVSAFNG